MQTFEEFDQSLRREFFQGLDAGWSKSFFSLHIQLQ
jgi:hypothetical protein